MRSIKFLSIVFITLNLLFSCKSDNAKNSSTKNKTEQKNAIVKLEKMEFHIKGMTCEIGCARLIQSKLSKKEGIKTAKVSFHDSIGMVEFDSNKLSQKDIIAVVEDIADGDLYKVKSKKIVTDFSIVD